MVCLGNWRYLPLATANYHKIHTVDNIVTTSLTTIIYRPESGVVKLVVAAEVVTVELVEVVAAVVVVVVVVDDE